MALDIYIHQYLHKYCFCSENISGDANDPLVSEYWGDKKFRYVPVEMVSGKTFSKTVAVWEGTSVQGQGLVYPGNTVLHPIAKTADGMLLDDDLRTEPPYVATFLDYNTNLSIKYWDNSTSSRVTPYIIRPKIPNGYEFYGWRYYDPYYGIYGVAEDGSNNAAVVLKPSYNFGGDISVRDEKTGEIEILKNADLLVNTNGLGSSTAYLVLVPVVKWISRTITYKTSDGEDYDSEICEGVTPVSLPDIERTGYGKVEWYSDANLSNDSFIGFGGDSYYPPSDITLYAKQTALSYNVILDANGGSVSPVLKVVTFDKIYDILPEPMRSGYVFDGWHLDSETGDEITSISVVSVARDHTLVARWLSAKITISKEDISGEVDVTSIGKLKLYSSKDNYLNPIAEESDGVIDYEGPSNVVYRVVLELESEGVDFSWSALGVNVAGEYISEYTFNVTSGATTSIKYVLEAKKFFNVSLEYDSSFGKAHIIKPAAPDKDGLYVEGREIVISYSPLEGCYLAFAKYFNTDGSLIGGVDSLSGNEISFELHYNTKVVLSFEKIKCSVAVDIDGPSVGVVNNVSISTEEVDYGQEVTLSASVAEGYFFDGWYLDGTKVSGEKVFTTVIIRDAVFLAKGGVEVLFGIEYQDNREDISVNVVESCTLSVKGVETDFPHTISVPLGQGFDYRLNVGSLYPEDTQSQEKWLFQSWKDENGNDVLFPAYGYMEPRSSTNITAIVTSAVKKKTVTIRFANNGESVSPADLLDIVTINPSYESVLESEASSISFSVVDSGWYTLTFKTEITLSDNSILYFNEASSSTMKWENGQYKLFVSDDCVVEAEYGVGGQKVIEVNFADQCNKSMGIISIGEQTSEENALPMSYTGDRLSEVSITAISYNGWKFLGWYRDAAGYATLFSDTPNTVIRITADMTLFAKFEKDLDAVYEWEGSTENKMMNWRSKTYVSSKPINPSACRIDSVYYPIPVLSFELFSSPNSAPTSKLVLTNIQSQDARRLPVKRSERYLQAYVEHADEVDAIFVGTSMGGLIV